MARFLWRRGVREPFFRSSKMPFRSFRTACNAGGYVLPGVLFPEPRRQSLGAVEPQDGKNQLVRHRQGGAGVSPVAAIRVSLPLELPGKLWIDPVGTAGGLHAGDVKGLLMRLGLLAG